MEIMAKKPMNSKFFFSLFGATFVGILLTGTIVVEPSPAIQAPSLMEIRHPVGPGEDLHLLAAYYYGDARQWKKIFQANRHQIKNPNRIYPQQILRIEVPLDWQPPMPFPAWMEKFRKVPPQQTPSPPPGKTPVEPGENEGSSSEY